MRTIWLLRLDEYRSVSEYVSDNIDSVDGCPGSAVGFEEPGIPPLGDPERSDPIVHDRDILRAFEIVIRLDVKGRDSDLIDRQTGKTHILAGGDGYPHP